MKYYQFEINQKNEFIGVGKTSYASNGNLALCVMKADGNPFGMITKNLGDCLDKDMAYVDVNNCLWAEDLIRKFKLGEPTGAYLRSGFVKYPLYKFNIGKIEEI